jgi:4'-phosphopantetheinyl transferase
MGESPKQDTQDMAASLAWRTPKGGRFAGKREIHLWRAALDLKAAEVEPFLGILSAEELEKAGRFGSKEPRYRFILARGLLRNILSLYLGTDPAEIRLIYDLSGKPALEGQTGRQALRFNLSHSGEMALFAVAFGRELGVDIERVRERTPWEQILKRFFTPEEALSIRDLPPEQRREAFFATWTLKEAYLKARGGGLPMGMDWFTVLRLPGEHVSRLRIPRNPQEARRWSLVTIDPGPGYMGALAVEGEGLPLKCWHWPSGGLSPDRT